MNVFYLFQLYQTTRTPYLQFVVNLILIHTVRLIHPLLFFILMACWEGGRTLENMEPCAQDERVLVLAASNRPFDPDEAVVRWTSKEVIYCLFIYSLIQHQSVVY